MEGTEEFAAGKNEVASDRVIDNFSAENQKLSLARLGIDVLPDALSASSRVTHITVLDLKHNSLQLLPSELFLCLTHLEEVDMSQNRLSYLPETLGLATGIRKLNLRGNLLRKLPNGLCLLHALEALDIAENSLEVLPAAIGGWQKLRRLDLANNNLKEIPHEGELLRSKVRRQKLVRRALQIRGSVRAAFVDDCLRKGT